MCIISGSVYVSEKKKCTDKKFPFVRNFVEHNAFIIYNQTINFDKALIFANFDFSLQSQNLRSHRIYCSTIQILSKSRN